MRGDAVPVIGVGFRPPTRRQLSGVHRSGDAWHPSRASGTAPSRTSAPCHRAGARRAYRTLPGHRSSPEGTLLRSGGPVPEAKPTLVTVARHRITVARPGESLEVTEELGFGKPPPSGRIGRRSATPPCGPGWERGEVSSFFSTSHPARIRVRYRSRRSCGKCRIGVRLFPGKSTGPEPADVRLSRRASS